ncbi:MAG: hypothetical protein LBF38_08045 [Deltaproteobacteria bacterium]|jgi:dihydroorotate dehydrogenase electron transfer subunit|nr:hypothetical protein [Deltaproteobacteria bacterium]
MGWGKGQISKPIMVTGKVDRTSYLGGDNYFLNVTVPKGYFKDLGRFVRLRAWPKMGQGPGTLLDRPFSIHYSSERNLGFLIREVGPGTQILTSLRKGDEVRVIGPLGRGLDELEPDFLNEKWYLVAGGAGLGPMGSMACVLGGRRAKLFYGERSGQQQIKHNDLGMLFVNLLSGGWENIVPTTEDGTGYGLKGLVTEPLIQSLLEEKRSIIGCGPKGLLAALAKIARKHGVKYLACAEERMACGLGVCLSCSLPKLDGSNFRVCQQGPLVDGLSLDWERIRA